jgi:hypothetical protein
MSLTQKNTTFNWSTSCTKAFKGLKERFILAPILMHYHADQQTILKTNASNYGIAVVLSQVNPNTNLLHPIAFFSHSMSTAKLNYKIYDKELLAIFTAFKEWRHYLEGISKTIEIITDHKNLKYFTTTKLLTCQQAQWSKFLSGFHYLFDITLASRGSSLIP